MKRVAVYLMVATAVGACASEHQTADSTESVSMPSANRRLSLDNCSVRLEFDELVLRLNTPSDHPNDEEVDVLRSVEPPSELAPAWRDVLAVVDAALAEGVSPSSLSDSELGQRGVPALQAVDSYVVETPCDPAGLPDSIGCPDAAPECAQQLAESRDRKLATTTVIESLATVDGTWAVLDCAPDDLVRLCRLEIREERRVVAMAEIRFMVTTDDRLIAWSSSVRA